MSRKDSGMPDYQKPKQICLHSPDFDDLGLPREDVAWMVK